MSEKEANWSKRALLFILIISAIRLAVLPAMNLTPQGAYYWQYAKHPALGYFDHPPVHAYIAMATTALFGDNVFAIRLGPWLCGVGVLFLILEFTRRLWGDRAGFLAVVLAGVTPLFSIGSAVLTPDPPLLFFWTLAVYLGYRTLVEDRKRWWILTGIACGLAMLSKYTAAFLAPGFLIVLIFSKRGREHLRSPWPYLGFIAATIAFAPQIIWNAENGWASFAFQSTRRVGELSRWRLDLFGGMVGTQLAVVSPLIFIGVIWASFRAAARGLFRERDFDGLYLASFSLPIILFFSLTALRYWVKMNWLAPAYITGLMAFVGAFAGRKQIIKWAVIVGAVETAALYILVLVPGIPLTGEAAYWEGWKEAAAVVDSLRGEMSDGTFVAGWGYKVPSELRFHLDGRPETYSNEILGRRGLNYDYWTKPDELLHRDCIFVADSREPFREERLLAEHFDSIAAPDTLRPLRGGKLLTTFRIWRCFGYTGP
ncbi:glycosyltransferase family 39 protein [bacterium]|nr:glycosyltransferase family 39 protein [bacterium]